MIFILGSHTDFLRNGSSLDSHKTFMSIKNGSLHHHKMFICFCNFLLFTNIKFVVPVVLQLISTVYLNIFSFLEIRG